MTGGLRIEVHAEFAGAANTIDELAIAAPQVQHAIAGLHITLEKIRDQVTADYKYSQADVRRFS